MDLVFEKAGKRPGLTRRTVDIANCMYSTGFDPCGGEEVFVARPSGDRKLQWALLLHFKDYCPDEGLSPPGGACDALIPAHPPREAVEARRERANDEVKGDHYHAVPKPGKKHMGQRPGRKSAGRRNRD